MSKINALLKQRFQARMNKLSARVTQRPVDDVGRGVGYLICEVGGVGGVKVMVPPDSVYYPGDSILVEQRGTPALAFYTVLGWETGARPTAGMIEFTGDTTVGNTTYPAGDLLWGNPYAAHFHMDYGAGQINLKSGDTLTGRVDAATGTFMAGNPTGLHGEFSASGIEFKNDTTVLSGWDAVGRTIFGVETLGRPHGPGIQQREIIDPDTGETRYVWQILGLNGVPGISFITGDESDPDDYRFYMGPLGASNRLIYENGDLDITGTLTWAMGKGVADSTGIEHTENATNFWYVKPTSECFLRVTACDAATETAILGQTDVGIGVYGLSNTGRGLLGVSTGGTGVEGNGGVNGTGIKGIVSGASSIGVYGNTFGGIAIHADVTLAGTALKISGGIVDGGGQRYTALADATAATDALNRQTGDARYPLRSDGWSGSFASGSNVLTVASGIITGIA